MRIRIFQVDAFSSVPFHGNPAAVCPLDSWLSDETMQAIAAENNLSETAFFVERDDGDYDLRWFTPTTEVDLCGHATLAAAWIHFTEIGHFEERVRFHTRSGELMVEREEDGLGMDFPSEPSEPTEPEPGLEEALGASPDVWRKGSSWIGVFEDIQRVIELEPDFRAMAELDTPFVSVTAPGNGPHSDVHFVSRFFAPGAGIDEDPVTGSAHCWLTPYWAIRLDEPELRARQISARGGELRCRDRGSRVEIAGDAVTVMRGHLELG
jgi:PhzF family phenazine biosynthesis protein